MQRAFVIRPFGTKKDSAGTEIDFERVHRELIGPATRPAAQRIWWDWRAMRVSARISSIVAIS
jgi:hypothetical protein